MSLKKIIHFLNKPLFKNQDQQKVENVKKGLFGTSFGLTIALVVSLVAIPYLFFLAILFL